MADTQLLLFGNSAHSSSVSDSKKTKKNVSSWCLYIDGAARNNPGPAGAGIYLLKNDSPMVGTPVVDTPVVREGFFLGSRTNNQAEYLALVIGAALIRMHVRQGERIRIISDSQLLVRQMMGQYRAKNPALKQLQKAAVDLLKGYEYRFDHVMREENVMADSLANKGIDQHVRVPEDIVTMLRTYGISL